ncbi:hypothetical protein WJX77_006191 [Trebouxia sp. C0004]
MLVARMGIAQMAIVRKTLSQLSAGHCQHCHGHLQTMQPDPPRDQETCKGRSREELQLQDMKRAIGGAQVLREMLLLPDQSKFNLEASAAYIADQKAQGSARRVDLEKTQRAVEGLAKLKNRARQMTTKQFNIDNGWTDDNKQQCGSPRYQ